MEEYVFERCHGINDLLIAQKSNEAREELIKLLDYHNKNDLRYSPLINHLIKETGLFPYIDKDTSDWEERFVVEAFKIDVGGCRQ